MAASSASIAVADSVWRQMKSSRSASDDNLAILHFLFGKNFERATIIVDQGGVKRVSGNPSCRVLFLMKSMKPFEIFQKILKSGSMMQGRLLGLDVGHKYVGLSISDISNKIASPVSVLVRKKTNINLMANDFQTLVSKFSLVGFVVGYPFSINGQHSVEAVHVRLFMEELSHTRNLDGVGYTYWDENYTSKCVEALLHPLNLHPVEHKTITDKFAAVGILQGYLDYMNRNLKTGLAKQLSTGK